MKRLFLILAGLTIGEWFLLISALVSPVAAYYSVRSDITISIAEAAAIKVELIKHEAEDNKQEVRQNRQFDILMNQLQTTNGRLDRVVDRLETSKKNQ